MGAYNNLALVEDDLKYLGVTKLRDGLASSPSAQPILDGLAKDGYTFDFVVPSSVPEGGTSALQAYLESVKAFATSHPGSVDAMEGLNEINLYSFSYNGSSSIEAAAQFQAAYYNAIKADATLSKISVYNLSLGFNDSTDYVKLGDLSGATDYANSHAYVSTSLTPHGRPPGPARQCHVGHRQRSGRDHRDRLHHQERHTLYWRQRERAGEVDPEYAGRCLQGRRRHHLSVSAARRLGDQRCVRSGVALGPVQQRRNPKLAATAIHNLTTILADDGKGGQTPTASLNYTLDGLLTTGNSMVLGKSNGAYELVVWAEPKIWNDATDTEISNPTTSVTVNLGSVHHLISVYDPLKGSSPIATYTDVSQIVVPVSDHPRSSRSTLPRAAAKPSPP